MRFEPWLKKINEIAGNLNSFLDENGELVSSIKQVELLNLINNALVRIKDGVFDLNRALSFTKQDMKCSVCGEPTVELYYENLTKAVVLCGDCIEEKDYVICPYGNCHAYISRSFVNNNGTCPICFKMV